MLTKDDILKISGYTDEKKFYKEFDTPEKFNAKYGKKIEKFLRKKGIEQAQGGIKAGLNSFSNYQPKGIPTQPEFETPNQAFSFAPGMQNQKGILPDFKNLSSDDINTAFGAASALGGAIEKTTLAARQKKAAKETRETLQALSPILAKANQGDMDRPTRYYRRPDDPDFLIQPDTLHNPLGSGQGLYAKNGGEIANTFAPNTIYTDLGEAKVGAEMIIEGVKTAGDMAAWIAGMNTRKIQKQNEQLMGQMATQPMLQNLQTTQYGSYMENGGMVNPQVTTSLEGIPLTKLFAPDPYMDTLRVGGHLKEYTPSSERAMYTGKEKFAMGGNLKVDGRGTIDFKGYNPELAKTGASGFIGISRGPSHDDGGFNLMYGEDGVEAVDNTPSMVEIEGNETVIETARDGFSKDKSLNILGDLHVGILDKAVSGGVNKTVLSELLKGRKLKDLKYKHLGNDIAKKTGRLNLEENKYLKMLDGFDQAPSQSYDLLKFNSAKAGMEGVQMRYKNLKTLQENLIDSQQAMNETADEMELNPNKLSSKATIEKAKIGKSISKAQTGVTKSNKNTALDLYNSGKIKEFQEFAQKNYPELVKNIIDEYGTPKGGWNDGINKHRTSRLAGIIKDLPEYTFASQPSEGMIAGLEKMVGKLPTGSVADAQAQIASDMAGLESQYSGIESPETKPGRFDKNIFDALKLYGNQILPFITPSNAEGLSPEQLSGEYLALATNQVVPVQAQKYSPQLRSNYYVSLADQLNKNEASYRAAQRMIGYNPAALASLNAQKYQANQQVLGEEFRLNQGLRDAIYAENLDKIAKADLINIDLLDKQYERQQGALSNTKAVQQAALNSINAKILQNRAENRMLRTMENTYGYRFDPKTGRAVNWNPLPTFDTEMDGAITMLDKEGNPVKYVKQEQKYGKTGLPEGSKTTVTTKTNGRNGILVKGSK